MSIFVRIFRICTIQIMAFSCVGYAADINTGVSTQSQVVAWAEPTEISNNGYIATTATIETQGMKRRG